MLAVHARAVALLQDLGQFSDEIVGDAVTAETRNGTRLEGRDQGEINVLFVVCSEKSILSMAELMRGWGPNK